LDGVEGDLNPKPLGCGAATSFAVDLVCCFTWVEMLAGDLAVGRKHDRGSLSWGDGLFIANREDKPAGLAKSYIIKLILNVNFSTVDGPDPPDLIVWVVLY
jgi:hypothetical protein